MILFQFQQFSLQFQAACIACERSVFAKNPVTGNGNPDGIFVAGHTNGPGGAWLSDGSSDLTVGSGFAIGNPAQFTPYRFLERRSAERAGECEILPGSCKILPKLRCGKIRYGSGGMEIGLTKPEGYHSIILIGNGDPAEGCGIMSLE